MTILPPYLKKGDTIGIVCPSGQMPYEKAATCIDVLQQWGYKVHVGKTLGSQFHYFSGTDQERLDDIQSMLDDPAIKAILCGRGGYGMSRIIDQLDFKQFRKHPKWIIGFSDVTVLHAHLYHRYNISSLHAPMAAAFNDGGDASVYVQSLRKALQGTRLSYTCEPHVYNRLGKAEGRMVGGNLSLVAHLIGTRSSFKTKDRILVLEDVGEYLYNIDRMLLQLKRSGMLDNLTGLIIGGFTEMKDTTTPFGADVFTIIAEQVKEYTYPICFDFPISHGGRNYAWKVGVKYELNVAKSGVKLRETVR